MTWKDKCKKTMNIPMIISIASIFLASIPPIRYIFTEPNMFLNKTITSTTAFIGSANYIMMIIMLGANLSLYRL